MNQTKIRKPKPSKKQAVAQLLTELPTMEREGLRQLWHDLFGQVPSHALRRETLIPILAYRIQEKAFGGLKESTASRLHEWVAEHAGCAKPLQTSLRPKTGTRYVREYRGKLHEVTVLESSFEYEGSTYRSLTEIAKVITGSQCSGPAFFGLKRKVGRVAA